MYIDWKWTSWRRRTCAGWDFYPVSLLTNRRQLQLVSQWMFPHGLIRRRFWWGLEVYRQGHKNSTLHIKQLWNTVAICGCHFAAVIGRRTDKTSTTGRQTNYSTLIIKEKLSLEVPLGQKCKVWKQPLFSRRLGFWICCPTSRWKEVVELNWGFKQFLCLLH